MENLPATVPETKRRAGRPKGSTNRITAKLALSKARELVDNGDSPLDVMLDNMLFWRRRAEAMTKLADEKILAINALDAKSPELVEVLSEFNKAAARLVAARAEAQNCARDAAPYVHPRLTSVTIDSPDPEAERMKRVAQTTTVQEAIETYRDRIVKRRLVTVTNFRPTGQP